MPTFLSHVGGWREAVLEIAQKAEDSSRFREEAAVTLACKGAVKAGDYLDIRVMQNLVAQLARTENPLRAPRTPDNHSARAGRTLAQIWEGMTMDTAAKKPLLVIVGPTAVEDLAVPAFS